MFDVSWTDDAIEELSRIWMDAHPEDRELITSAVNDIEETLMTPADTAGESRSEIYRILIVSNVAVQYHFWPDRREAQVGNVWRMNGGSAPE